MKVGEALASLQGVVEQATGDLRGLAIDLDDFREDATGLTEAEREEIDRLARRVLAVADLLVLEAHAADLNNVRNGLKIARRTIAVAVLIASPFGVGVGKGAAQVGLDRVLGRQAACEASLQAVEDLIDQRAKDMREEKIKHQALLVSVAFGRLQRAMVAAPFPELLGVLEIDVRLIEPQVADALRTGDDSIQDLLLEQLRSMEMAAEDVRYGAGVSGATLSAEDSEGLRLIEERIEMARSQVMSLTF